MRLEVNWSCSSSNIYIPSNVTDAIVSFGRSLSPRLLNFRRLVELEIGGHMASSDKNVCIDTEMAHVNDSKYVRDCS